jgi:hypothetical protein
MPETLLLLTVVVNRFYMKAIAIEGAENQARQAILTCGGDLA